MSYVANSFTPRCLAPVQVVFVSTGGLSPCVDVPLMTVLATHASCVSITGATGVGAVVAPLDDGGFDIAVTATPADFVAELAKLPNVGSTNVLVSLPDPEGGREWTVTLTSLPSNVDAVNGHNCLAPIIDVLCSLRFMSLCR